MAREALRWEEKALLNQLGTFNARAERAIGAVLRYHATRAQAYARRNAPWTDRTSNARNGLFARYSKAGTTHRIDIYHSVSYGIWLEVRFSGRYAIIRPTIDHEGPEVMTTISQLYGRMFK